MAAESVTSELDRLVEELAAAFTRDSDPDGRKLALALAIVEDVRRMSTGGRDEMAERLDDLEDLLDGLFVAAEALRSEPGGAARG